MHLDIDPSIEILDGMRCVLWQQGMPLCLLTLPGLVFSGAKRRPIRLVACTTCPPTPVCSPFMMPIFFYGGQISKAMESPSLSAAQQVALTEIRSLLVWLLMQVGGRGWVGRWVGGVPGGEGWERRVDGLLQKRVSWPFSDAPTRSHSPGPSSPLPVQLNIISREQAEAFLHFEPLARPSNIDHRACGS